MDINLYAEEVKSDILFSLRRLCDKLYAVTGDCLEECDNFILEMEQTIDSSETNDLQKIFDYGYNFGSYDKNNKIPFYVYMEIIAEILDTQIKNKENQRRVSILVDKIRKLKDFTKVFSKDKKFNSEKKMDDTLITNLMKSKGKISIFFNEEYREFPMINFDVLSQKKIFFYKEDEEKYRQILIEQYDELKEMYSQVVKRYFVDGKLPEHINIEEKLNSKNIPNVVRESLRQLAFSRMDYENGLSDELEWMKANLVNIKFILRKEQENAELKFEEIEEIERKMKVMEPKEESLVRKRSKREILKELFELIKEFVGVSGECKKRK